MFVRIVAGISAVVILSSTGLAQTPVVEFINSEQVLSLNLPFSQAVRVGNMLYLSGTLGLEPGTSTLVAGGVAAETRQALQNIKALLEGNGASLDKVVKCTVMLADIADYAAMNESYVESFSGPKPARSTFAAQGLALGARVEIECWAVLD